MTFCRKFISSKDDLEHYLSRLCVVLNVTKKLCHIDNGGGCTTVNPKQVTSILEKVAWYHFVLQVRTTVHGILFQRFFVLQNQFLDNRTTIIASTASFSALEITNLSHRTKLCRYTFQTHVTSASNVVFLDTQNSPSFYLLNSKQRGKA